MAAPSAKNTLQLPGKLCKDPTDLSADFPHGGTALGLVRAVKWRPRRAYFPVEAEEFGTVVEAIYSGDSAVLVCVARELDSDYLSSIFLNTAAGSTTGRRVVSGRPATDDVRAGTSLEGQSVKLYYSPDNAKDHGLLFFRAVPMVDVAAEIDLGLNQEAGILCVWQATPDDSGRTYDLGPREDLTL